MEYLNKVKHIHRISQLVEIYSWDNTISLTIYNVFLFLVFPFLLNNNIAV